LYWSWVNALQPVVLEHRPQHTCASAPGILFMSLPLQLNPCCNVQSETGEGVGEGVGGRGPERVYVS
jgi:hypothetical protein